MPDMLSFGTMNTSQNRFFWRGAYSAGTIYNAYDVVSYLGSAYIALTTQSGVVPTTTGSWDQMTSAGAVTSVAGRVGNVVLSASDLTNGTTGTGAVVLASGPTLVDPVINTLNVTGSSGLAAAGTGGQIAGGFASPSVIRHYLGDGTGWRIEFAKRLASVDTVQAWITDGGVINAVSGYQVNGSALAFTNISGTVAATQLPNPAVAAKGGVQSKAAVTHNFLTAINTDGSVSQAQPAFSDISGTVAATQLPAPTASTLGGIESFAAQTSKWINTISTAGVPSATQPAASDLSNGVTGSGAVVLASAPTMTNPVINGRPTGTGIPTVTLKKGSGGGNYTGTNTTYSNVDGTNLSYTVTIPIGWKLMIAATGTIFVSTSGANVFVALADGGTVVVESGVTAPAATVPQFFGFNWAINGDGNSHTLTLQAKTGTAADAWNIGNANATSVPQMTFLLTPSN